MLGYDEITCIPCCRAFPLTKQSILYTQNYSTLYTNAELVICNAKRCRQLPLV